MKPLIQSTRLIQLLFTASLFLPALVKAQNTSSPYSILGIGDIEQNNFDRTSGMASTGLAYRSARFMSHSNPASYSALQSQFFNVELGGRAKFVKYVGNNITTSQEQDFGIEKLAVGMRLNKWWGSSVGLLPFSTSNYYFSTDKYIQGDNETVKSVYKGSGGVHKLYWGNSFQPFKNLSVGVSTGMLFGSLNQADTIQGTDGSALATTTRNIWLRNFFLEYGLQYYGKLGEKWKFGLGGTYTQQNDLSAEYTVDVEDANGSTVKSDIIKNDYYTLPEMYGVGIMLSKNDRYTFTGDYKYQGWSSLGYKGDGYTLTDSHRFSVGFEWSKRQNVFEGGGVTIETMYLQSGAYYNQSYLNVYNTQLEDYGVTLGLGGLAKRSGLGYQVVLGLGQRGTSKNNLVRETYTTFNITLSYRDFWFTKGRKYD